MNSLHILNRPASHAAAQACLIALQPGDALLLIEDGVLELANKDSALWSLQISQLFALEPDLHARAITPTQAIETLNYEGFVTLTTQHSPVISWY